MAKKRPVKKSKQATGHDPREVLLARIANWTVEDYDPREILLDRIAKQRELFATHMRDFKADTCVKTTLLTAYGYWGGYPFAKGLCVDSPRILTSDEEVLHNLDFLQIALDRCHKNAVHQLMVAAEHWGLDSSSILKSANYCRELFLNREHKFYPSNRETDYWPDCLGETLYTLQSDVRQSIIDGNAQVERLHIKNADVQKSGQPIKVAAKGIPGRKPNENKRKHAEYANELRSQLPPKTWKECAVTVNENFGLTGDDSYTFERIRGLHRLKCGDKATGK